MHKSIRIIAVSKDSMKLEWARPFRITRTVDGLHVGHRRGDPRAHQQFSPDVVVEAVSHPETYKGLLRAGPRGHPVGASGRAH